MPHHAEQNAQPSLIGAAGIRRLDHVAILVRDTDSAVEFFTSRMGLRVAHAEESSIAGARLTYIDVGNAYLQLIEPISEGTPLMRQLQDQGEGLHHVCFGVEGVASTVARLGNGAEVALGSGRGRVSAFVPGEEPFGVLFEGTEFNHAEDVDGCKGWLDGTIGASKAGAGESVGNESGRRDS